MHDLDTTGHGARFDVDAEHLSGVVRFLGARQVRSLTMQPPTLEQLFLRHHGADGGADGADRLGVRP